MRRASRLPGVGATGVGLTRSAAVDAAAATGGVLCLAAPEQRLPERDLVLGVGEQARSPPRVGADVGAERLPRVGLLGRGLARDAPPRGPQRAAVEGQGAVRFRFRRRRDRDGFAAGRVRLGQYLREAVELLRERPRFRRPEALERQRGTKTHGGLDGLYDRAAGRRGRPSGQLRAKARAAQNNHVAGDRCGCVDECLLHVFVLQSEHRHIDGPDVDAPVAVAEPVHALPQQRLPGFRRRGDAEAVADQRRGRARRIQQTHDGAVRDFP